MAGEAAKGLADTGGKVLRAAATAPFKHPGKLVLLGVGVATAGTMVAVPGMGVGEALATVGSKGLATTFSTVGEVVPAGVDALVTNAPAIGDSMLEFGHSVADGMGAGAVENTAHSYVLAA